MYLDPLHSFPPCKLLQSPFDLHLMDTLCKRREGHGTNYRHSLCKPGVRVGMVKEGGGRGGQAGSRTTRSSHLHLQHLLENGLGQTFPRVSLVAPLHQLVFVFLVRDDASTTGDLTVTRRTRTTRLLRNQKHDARLRFSDMRYPTDTRWPCCC